VTPYEYRKIGNNQLKNKYKNKKASFRLEVGSISVYPIQLGGIVGPWPRKQEFPLNL
jgi:hypothetical protein